MAKRYFNKKNSLSDITFFAHGCWPHVLPLVRVLFVLQGADMACHVRGDRVFWTPSGEMVLRVSLPSAPQNQVHAALPFAPPLCRHQSVDVLFVLDPSVSICAVTLSFHGCLGDSC
jgi:hypothetical protein